MLLIRVTGSITVSMETASPAITANTRATRAMLKSTRTLPTTVIPKASMLQRLRRCQITPISALLSLAPVTTGWTATGISRDVDMSGSTDIGRVRPIKVDIGWRRATPADSSSWDSGVAGTMIVDTNMDMFATITGIEDIGKLPGTATGPMNTGAALITKAAQETGAGPNIAGNNFEPQCRPPFRLHL